jgi:hypothetical protein
MQEMMLGAKLPKKAFTMEILINGELGAHTGNIATMCSVISWIISGNLSLKMMRLM